METGVWASVWRGFGVGRVPVQVICGLSGSVGGLEVWFGDQEASNGTQSLSTDSLRVLSCFLKLSERYTGEGRQSENQPPLCGDRGFAVRLQLLHGESLEMFAPRQDTGDC